MCAQPMTAPVHDILYITADEHGNPVTIAADAIPVAEKSNASPNEYPFAFEIPLGDPNLIENIIKGINGGVNANS